jgi:hypothetical protein
MSTNSSLTDSINKDITSSLSRPSPSPSPSTLAPSTTSSPKSSSGSSYIFFLFIIVVFGLLVFLFFYYYEGWKEKIISFLPSFLPSSSPTPAFEPITTPPVNTISPTSIPTTNIYDQQDNLQETQKTSGTKEPQIDRPTQGPPDDDEYKPDDSYSTVQQNQSTGKSGWCFIGEDRGFRSCSPVSASDTCMSGDIFPSKDICVNPNLRWSS